MLRYGENIYSRIAFAPLLREKTLITIPDSQSIMNFSIVADEKRNYFWLYVSSCDCSLLFWVIFQPSLYFLKKDAVNSTQHSTQLKTREPLSLSVDLSSPAAHSVKSTILSSLDSKLHFLKSQRPMDSSLISSLLSMAGRFSPEKKFWQF